MKIHFIFFLPPEQGAGAWKVDAVGESVGPSTGNPTATPKQVESSAKVPKSANKSRTSTSGGESVKHHSVAKQAAPRGTKRRRDVLNDDSDDDDSGRGWWKHCKLESFPKDIPATQKWEHWMDWHRRFRIITKQMGNVAQSEKADLLYVMAGPEIQRIINTMGMHPENTCDGYETAYKDLVASLEDYFKGLSDPSVNLTNFNNLKQAADEGARDFQLRVLRQASLCGITSSNPMMKERFARGLKNQELA